MRVDECELPDGRIMPKYYVMEFTDWIQVFALTKNNEVVFVDQYRHAKQERFMELPGGSKEVDEDEVTCAKRELLEETGYQCGNIIEIGKHYPNPALQNNAVRVFLATDCEVVSDQKLDPYEDLTVKLVPLNEVWENLEEGSYTHSLMVASLVLARKFLF